MSNIKFVKINHDDLEGIRPVLESWMRLVVKYSESSSGQNCCYWFNERANISILAGAAWRSSGDWLALEEFLTFKHGNDEDLKNGRCDLFVEDVLQKKHML